MMSFENIISKFNKENVFIKKCEIDEICFIVCELFSRYVIEGTLSENISHDYDPPWDCSGTLITEIVDEKDLLSCLFKKYKTLKNWSESTYTGATIAIGVSGCGLSHETYEDVIIQIVEDTIYTIIGKYLGQDWESEKLDELSLDLEYVLLEKINIISLNLAWDLTEKTVREKIKQESIKHNVEQKEKQNRILFAKDITEKYFFKYFDLRIESPNKKDLIKTIQDIYPCLSVEELEAIKHEGLNLSLSNKVSGIIRNLAEDEILKRKL